MPVDSLGAALWPVLLIGVASNLDNLGVGVAYGTLGIAIPPGPNLLIALIALGETLLAASLGRLVAHLLPAALADGLGAAMIVAVGVWILRGGPGSEGGLADLMRHPQAADRDGSRSIGLGEAAFLGQALAMNNVFQGVGAGLMGLPPWAVATTGAGFSYLCTWGGAAGARSLGSRRLGRWTRLAAGALLILVGLNQLPLGNWL